MFLPKGSLFLAPYEPVLSSGLSGLAFSIVILSTKFPPIFAIVLKQPASILHLLPICTIWLETQVINAYLPGLVMLEFQCLMTVLHLLFAVSCPIRMLMLRIYRWLSTISSSLCT